MLIGRLKYGKAAGIDAITTDLLKVCADNSALLEALCELFNRALTTSRCPAEWALAFVVPLFKKGCPYSWTNYRCISLLSVVGKLYEAVLANRLSRLFDGRDRDGAPYLSECQGGFRRNRRCQHQSFVLTAQNETPFGLPPASILGRSNVDHAQCYVSLLWSRLRDDYAYNF